MTMLIFMGGQRMAQRGDGAVRRRGVAVAGDAFTHAPRETPRESARTASIAVASFACNEPTSPAENTSPSLRR